jgi:hypothetical protein
MTYPNLTACISCPEARICILLVPFKRKQFEVCGNVKGNVGEYNIIDLVKENTKKKQPFFFFCTIIFEMQEKSHNVLFQPRCNLEFGH